MEPNSSTALSSLSPGTGNQPSAMTRLPVAPPFLTECPRIRLPTERLTCRGDRTQRIGPSKRSCRWRTRMTVAKRELGRTGLQVTTLGYGAMELRGAPRARDISEEQAETILRAVLDSGINYIDTSIDYGLSEERIGRFIGKRRDEFLLASKCGCPVQPVESSTSGRAPHEFTPANIVAGVEQSLRRLQTDYLDVGQFHSSPSKETLQHEGGLEALLGLQRQGKVRFIGMSGTLPNLPEQIEMGVFDVFQIPYSAVQVDLLGQVGQCAGH